MNYVVCVVLDEEEDTFEGATTSYEEDKLNNMTAIRERGVNTEAPPPA